MTGNGDIWRWLPTCRERPAHPPVGEAPVLVCTLPRQVITLLPCQDDIRSLSRDLTQASVLGSRLLLSRKPKYQQRRSAWILFLPTAKHRTGKVFPLDQRGNWDSERWTHLPEVT